MYMYTCIYINLHDYRCIYIYVHTCTCPSKSIRIIVPSVTRNEVHYTLQHVATRLHTLLSATAC